ncbi:hypothetical protein V3W47_17165, partial [Deinococcus sp. YIM 134068]|uniref:hypothetical protein n=1 Tax=Deinococcus lichenicola TaxID=3118910 RepID=UPI002F938AF2
SLELSQDSLVESRSVPGGIFSCHKQKVSPTGDAFSYFLSGGQEEWLKVLREDGALGIVEEVMDGATEKDTGIIFVVC